MTTKSEMQKDVRRLSFGIYRSEESTTNRRRTSEGAIRLVLSSRPGSWDGFLVAVAHSFFFAYNYIFLDPARGANADLTNPGYLVDAVTLKNLGFGVAMYS